MAVLAGLAGIFSNLLFLLFVVAFMALDAVGFSGRLSRARRQRAEVVGALDTFVHGTRSYLVVSTVFGLIVAAIDTGFLWLVGVPLPLLWGLLAFITNYIPNVGFIIGLVPPALLALLEGGPRLMVIVIVAYSVINFIIQSIIQPKFVSDAVNLSLDADVPLAGLLGVRDRPARGGARDTVDIAGEGAAARRGPEHQMDFRPARRRVGTARGSGRRRDAGERTRRLSAPLSASTAGSATRQPVGMMDMGTPGTACSAT